MPLNLIEADEVSIEDLEAAARADIILEEEGYEGWLRRQREAEAWLAAGSSQYRTRGFVLWREKSINHICEKMAPFQHVCGRRRGFHGPPRAKHSREGLCGQDRRGCINRRWLWRPAACGAQNYLNIGVNVLKHERQ